MRQQGRSEERDCFMTRVWVLVLVLSATVFAREPEEEGVRLRTFIGGYSSAGFITSTFHVGFVGIAGDVGLQLGDNVAVSMTLRGSTSGVTNWVQVAPSFEWSSGFFSLGVGVGAALSANLIPNQLGGLRPVLAAPLTLGFSTAPVPDGTRMGSVRFNVELVFLWQPQAGYGGVIGVSIGRQSR